METPNLDTWIKNIEGKRLNGFSSPLELERLKEFKAIKEALSLSVVGQSVCLHPFDKVKRKGNGVNYCSNCDLFI